jgi:DNA-binding GntR family transcriptional regulator
MPVTVDSLRAVIQPAAGPDTTQQHAVAALRRAIVGGDLRPGQRVIQEDLAERLGMSVAPVREALRVLEQEGQLTYRPRRGYFVTELRVEDLEEIYGLRTILEERAVRHAVPMLDAEALDRVVLAAKDCMDAAEAGDVAGELAANRRFHFGVFDAADQPHVMRLIQLLWDSTEAYRAMYYNSPAERRASVEAHDRILDALRASDMDRLVAELDAHRQRGLDVLRDLLTPEDGSEAPAGVP